MIDREKVIKRHNPHYKNLNKNAPLSIGNGSFCFTADFTGLQTFFNDYSVKPDAFPLCTMSDWGWHSYPMSKEDEALLRLTPFKTYERDVYYASCDTGQEELFKKIRVNAHKFHLGKIGFDFSDNGISIDNCKPVSQILNLWEGILSSEFEFNNETVKTETFVHPDEDCLYVRASSVLFNKGDLRVNFEFPYGSHKKTGADFSSPGLHKTSLQRNLNKNKERQELVIKREIDGTTYNVLICGSGFNFSVNENSHSITLLAHDECIELCVRFEPACVSCIPQSEIDGYKNYNKQSDSFNDAIIKCKTFWKNYWSSGGIADFSASSSARAIELERRIVLSQYLIAIQSRGKNPPAETGLTCNSWYGKFHLEMIFWHHAQFALWGRTSELKKSLEYYKKILPQAKEIAASQGYKGARWPKMCDPSGKNTPSSIAVFLLWQQPHPVMFIELIYRENKDINFLREYREIIIETAEFIKSFIHWEENRYVLGPPFIPAQERHDPKIVLNAPFETEYFRWCLIKADEYISLLGDQKRYGDIIEKISLPPQKDGLYIAHENCPNTFTEFPFYTDHPSMLAMYGVLNSDRIDKEILSVTLDKVLSVWEKETFYGWDFSMMAMTACRLGRHSEAIELLLMDSPKNTWLKNGHNKQTGDDALSLYLPGNGGFLLAAAMLLAGFDGNEGAHLPEGFSAEVEGVATYI